MSPKYFLYISDTKVDMLYAQIPRAFLDGVSRELKVDLKLPSVSLKQSEYPDTRFSKLDVVCRYIDKHFDVGEIDSPAAYFRGRTTVRWGPYGSDDRLVYFCDATSNTIFGLGGSGQYVTGAKSTSEIHSYSATPYLHAVLCDELKLARGEDLELQGMSKEQMKLSALDATYLAAQLFDGPEQEVEFLAKKLLFAPGQARSADEWPNREGKGVLLGSPLYVALVD
ncbi:hypothetical protein MRS60_28575 [Burkholderia pyrrocinia]|uniref:DUF7019 family protein n=1 Tax=Burkholderia pyrrocinia TaxID=60550 RepID=UPI001FB2239A|nr:SAVMC3_10250 family protein [Burkholderia pyrrocinia]UOB58132.1 hypothetical protein MRS60_28575 [Burkholderia pyrrocinia]